MTAPAIPFIEENRMRFSLITTIFFALSAVGAAEVPHAPVTMTMAGYFDAKKAGGMDWASAEIFLTGIANGFTAANTALASNNQKLLFCAPSMTMNSDNINDILETEYSTRPALWNPTDTIRTVLLVGMMKAFPCK
jgi:hypothetical protein